MANKQHTVRVISDTGNTSEWTGTIDYLIDDVFGYTLECNGMGTKFKRPKTIKSLVNRLNSGRSYWSMRNSYKVVD